MPCLSKPGTLPGRMKGGEDSFSCVMGKQSQSKVYTRLEISLSSSQTAWAKGKKISQEFWGRDPEKYLQISGASSDPSGQSLSPSHRQPLEIQVIWSLQANCLGLQVLGTRGKERKRGVNEG